MGGGEEGEGRGGKEEVARVRAIDVHTVFPMSQFSAFSAMCLSSLRFSSSSSFWYSLCSLYSLHVQIFVSTHRDGADLACARTVWPIRT